MANTTLTLQSSNEELKAYFEAVCKIVDSNSDEFPINLDEVWTLCYARRDYATDALKKDFIENVDYTITSVKTEVGSTRYEYHLTTSCFEFFIARKVRPVFEVYRQVFHAARRGELFRVPQTFKEALLLAAAQQEQIEEQQELLVAQSEQIRDLNECNAEMRVKVSYYDQILASKSTVTTTQIAQDYGMSAKKFNIELRNLKIQRKVGGQWILYSPYNTMGYVHSDTFVPEKSTTGKVVMTTKWTQKGRMRHSIVYFP